MMNQIIDMRPLLVFQELAEKGTVSFMALMRVGRFKTPSNLASALKTYERNGLVKIMKHFVERKPETLIELTTRGRQEWNLAVKTMERPWTACS